MVCNIATDANRIMTELMANESTIVIPPVDVDNIEFPVFPDMNFDAPNQIKNTDLTERKVDGCGTFDFLMSGINAHLHQEYTKSRITGNDYSKVYIAGIEAAMSNATQFLLGKDQAYWAAITAQQQSKLIQTQIVTAKVQLETAKVQLALAQYEALTARSNFALTKAKLATEEMTYCTGEYQLENILPQELLNLKAQAEILGVQKTQITQETARTVADTARLGSEKLNIEESTKLITANTQKTASEKLNVEENTKLTTSQTAKVAADTSYVDAQRTHLTTLEGPKVTAETNLLVSNKALTDANKLGVEATTQNTIAQKAVIIQQEKLLKEQTESQAAQTLDQRSDGLAVKGAIGKQKELQDQQITSYKRDVEIKTARMYLDSWITQKTMDEGLTAPVQFTNATVDQVFGKLKTNTQL